MRRPGCGRSVKTGVILWMPLVLVFLLWVQASPTKMLSLRRYHASRRQTARPAQALLGGIKKHPGLADTRLTFVFQQGFGVELG